MDHAYAPTLRIGELAKRAGVGIETIRFYEREALIPEPARDASSGYRRYPERMVRRLRFIARAKELGFTLRETRELLDMRASDDATCATVRSRAQEKLEDVRRRIRDFRQIEDALVSLSMACPGQDEGIEECPILAALDEGFADEED